MSCEFQSALKAIDNEYNLQRKRATEVRTLKNVESGEYVSLRLQQMDNEYKLWYAMKLKTTYNL